MMEGDPLAVIAYEQPEVGGDEAKRAVREHYGLEVTVSPLVSERDRNYLLRTTAGSCYVLKIANAAEDPVVTDFQIQALLHIERAIAEKSLPILAPRVVRTREGATEFMLETAAGAYLSRVVTFIEGTPLGERVPSPALARDMGRFLAHLGRALVGFSHPGSRHSLLWDIQHALRLRPLIEHVREPAAADAVSAALDDFEQRVAPRLPSFRRQVVHSDFNADNVVIETADPDKVAGVIDFGDMVEAPLVADAAIGASYVRTKSGDPLSLMNEFLAAYHGVTPLYPDELEVFFELIQARLSASIVILDWRASLRGAGDPYLAKVVHDETSARQVLKRLREIPRGHALRQFREVCASVDQARASRGN